MNFFSFSSFFFEEEMFFCRPHLGVVGVGVGVGGGVGDAFEDEDEDEDGDCMNTNRRRLWRR